MQSMACWVSSLPNQQEAKHGEAIQTLRLAATIVSWSFFGIHVSRTMPTDDYAKDPKMRTPVHAAAKRGHAAMFVQRNTKNCEAAERSAEQLPVDAQPTAE